MGLVPAILWQFDTTGGFTPATPAVSYVAAISPVLVEVGFNTPMQQGGGGIGDALEPSNYSIPGLTISGVKSATPTRVHLSVNEMVNNQSYTLTAGNYLVSDTGVQIQLGAVSMAFAGLGYPLTIASINTLLNPAGTLVRITFSEAMQFTPDVVDVSSYTFTSGPNVTKIVPQSVSFGGNSVDVTVTPMQLGGTYLLTIGGNVLDVAGNGLAVNQATFTGFQVVVRPKVVGAAAVDYQTVQVTFSEPVVATPALLTPETYSLTGGLKPTGVQLQSPTQVLVTTTYQVGDKSYNISVSSVVYDANGETLDPNNDSASFVGIAAPAPVTVVGLTATTHPDGNRIDLAWTNPSGAAYTKIVRKATGVPFDASDGYTVYAGQAVTSFSDTDQLQDNMFYSYLVLASVDGLTFPIDPVSSVVSRLSIRAIGSGDWIWDNLVPEWYKLQDAAVNANGGIGLFAPVIQVMGAAVNIMRGELEAYGNSGDPDRVSPTVLGVWNQALNFDPEESFDTSALRRIALHIIHIYKMKGTVPAVIALAKVLCQWDCDVLQYGSAQGTLFKTWDGVTRQINRVFAPVFQFLYSNQANYLQGTISARGSFIDTAMTFDGSVQDFSGWTLFDPLGRQMNIVAFTTVPVPGFTGFNVIKFFLEVQVDAAATLNEAASVGDRTVVLSSMWGLRGDEYLMISDGTNTQVCEIRSINPGVSLTLQEPLLYAFGAGTEVYLKADIVSLEMRGEGAAVDGGFHDPDKNWQYNAWSDYVLMDANGAQFPISGNDANTVFVTGTPAEGQYAIANAWGYEAGVTTFAKRIPYPRYTLTSPEGVPLSRIYEPLVDPTLAGTKDDPIDRLYAGETSVGAGYSNDDYALFVKKGVAQAVGEASGVALTVLTDDKAAMIPGSLVGMYLNPNRKQQRLFKIRANTATTITVEQNIEGYGSQSDFYFVLKERDALKYTRLNAVLPEFSPRDMTPFIQFS